MHLTFHRMWKSQEQITRRAKIEALDRSIEALNFGLKDLIEETSKYRQQ